MCTGGAGEESGPIIDRPRPEGQQPPSGATAAQQALQYSERTPPQLLRDWLPRVVVVAGVARVVGEAG